MNPSQKTRLTWEIALLVIFAVLGYCLSVSRFSKGFVMSKTGVGESGPTFTSTSMMDMGCVVHGGHSLPKRSSVNVGIRFKGKFCDMTSDRRAGLKNLVVNNITAETRSSILAPTRDGRFISDVVPLVRGKNVIEVNWFEAGNTQLQSFLCHVTGE